LLQGHVEDAEAKKALCRADTLLNMKHGMVRLDNVWGVGGGIKPVKYLVSRISSCFYQYFGSIHYIRFRIQHFWLNTDPDPEF
jgi:programmed cell death protein 4